MSAATAQSKIELRDFPAEDFPIIWRWLQKYKAVLFHDDGPQTEREFVDKHLARGSRNFGVYCEGQLVGLFICDHVTPFLCEAHVYFKQSFFGWKNTCAALLAGIQWAFTEGGYEKIGARVMESNRAMIALLEHLGAQQEARFVAHARQNGQPVNVVYYSIFKGA